MTKRLIEAVERMNAAALECQKAFALMLPELQKAKRGLEKGQPNRRMLSKFKIVDGVRYQLHATKGWRKVK